MGLEQYCYTNPFGMKDVAWSTSSSQYVLCVEHHTSKAKKTEEPVVKKPRLSGKPFGRLLEGVTLVISGYQNPHRANLRTMALEMGARYKSDWDSSCTHLV
jgi:DNA-repair protein XRCC1